MKVTACRRCNARITWVRTRRGDPMPIDPRPTPAGNVVLIERTVRLDLPEGADRPRDYVAVVLGAGQAPPEEAGGAIAVRYRPHFGACPGYRPRRPGHQCSVPGCPIRVAPDRLMCSPHWFTVAYPLRAEVRDLWREWQRDSRQLAIRRRYLEARRRAIACAVAQEQARAQGQGVLFNPSPAAASTPGVSPA